MSRSRPLSMALLVLAVVLAGVALAVVALRGPGSPRSLEERTRAVARTLRCPVCQNLSVADSPSGIAEEMRRSIAAELHAGRSPDEIRDQFVRAYGQWILLAPPKRGLDLLAWVVPAVLVGGAVLAAWLAVRRWTLFARPDALQIELNPADRTLLDRAMAARGDDEG